MKRVLQGLAEEEKKRKQRRIDRERRSLNSAIEEREARDNLEERVNWFIYLFYALVGKKKNCYTHNDLYISSSSDTMSKLY